MQQQKGFEIELVSIIIPVYNAQKNIHECLDSIINQSLKEIEIICIDDGSSDNSAETIETYIKKDKRIKYFKLDKNSGSGVARNLGIKKSKGEFIAFMDSDDYYYDIYALESLYLLSKEHKVDAVAGNIIVYNNSTKEENIFHTMYFNKDSFMNISEYLYYGAYQRFIFRRNIFFKYNISFPPYRRRQDPVFFYQIMLKIKKFYVTKENIYVYRTSHKKVTWNEVNVLDALASYSDNMKLLFENSLDEHYRIEVNNFKNNFLNKPDICRSLSVLNKMTLLKTNIKYSFLKESISKCLSLDEKNAHKNLSLQICSTTKDKKIIIYGFGNLGNYLYETLKDSYTVIGIIDNAFSGLKVDDLVITNTISRKNNNKIIISILNENTKITIKKFLLSKGVKLSNIIYVKT